MAIKINNLMAFRKVRSNNQKCSACGGKMRAGKYGLSIQKPVSSGHFNFWIHIGCIDQFAEKIKKAKSENARKITIQNL